MSQRRNVHQAFVNHELIRLGRHGIAIQAVERAEGLRILHRNGLKAAWSRAGRMTLAEQQGGIGAQGQTKQVGMFHVKHSVPVKGRCLRQSAGSTPARQQERPCE